MAWGIGDIFKAMKGGMTDDEGLFQGGAQDRVFGRGRDSIANLFGGGEMNRARKFAKNFDTSSEKDVLKLQQMLNSLGFVDSERNELAEDSILGNKTLSALRNLQAGESYEPSVEDVPEETSYDYEPGKGPSGPIDPWAETEGESTMMRNAPGNSVWENVRNLFSGSSEGRKAATGPNRAIFGDYRTRD